MYNENYLKARIRLRKYPLTGTLLQAGRDIFLFFAQNQVGGRKPDKKNLTFPLFRLYLKVPLIGTGE